jgi:hypothetical protein
MGADEDEIGSHVQFHPCMRLAAHDRDRERHQKVGAGQPRRRRRSYRHGGQAEITKATPTVLGGAVAATEGLFVRRWIARGRHGETQGARRGRTPQRGLAWRPMIRLGSDR